MRISARGFTLVEVLIAIAISSVLGGLLLSMLGQNNGLFLTQTSKVSQGISINDSTSEIYDSIKNSSGVVTGYPSVNPQYFTGSQTLILQTPSIDVSGNIIANNFDTTVFTLDTQNPSVLKKYFFPHASSSRKSENKVLGTKISYLNFSYLDQANMPVAPDQAERISVILNLSENIGLDPQTSSASGTINLRNN